jgi:enediyne biosynthesis protein E4
MTDQTHLGGRDVMDTPRQRSLRQRVVLWRTAAVSLAAGLTLFFVTERHPAQSAPLSFVLEEKTAAQTGLQFQHEKGAFAPFFDNVLPFMQAVSASACVADVDKDGLLDLYLTTSGPGAKNKLFFNRGGFSFEAADLPVIEDLNEDGFSSDCVFADVDNDGFEDLFVGTVGQRPRLFLNRPDDEAAHGRGFVDATERSGLGSYMNGFAVVFFDVDNDGDLDLLYTSYFPERYPEEDVPGAPYMHPTRVPDSPRAGRMMPNDWGNATNGGEKHFFLNDGTGHFEEHNLEDWGFSETRFTFDIGTADINGDGWTDLYFANDFGPDQLYLNKEGRFFVDVKGPFPTSVGKDAFKGMNADLADIDHDGFPEIYVTNVFHPVLPEGNLLWHNRPHPSGDPFLRSFANIAADLGVQNGGWGWGAKFVDIDNDGDVDLLATNGYISADPKKDYWYRMSRLVAGDRQLIVDSTRWPDFGESSMSGHQVSHVFVREGERYYNRAADTGLTRSFDGRGVLIADFDLDGRADVLWVAQGQPYLLAKNRFVATATTPTAPSWVGLRLEGDGVRVSRSAVGTRVKVTPANGAAPGAVPHRHFEVSAGNGMSAQSMPWILAGLGAYEGLVDVEIRWLDGSSQRLEGIAPRRYHDVRYARASAGASSSPPGRKTSP